MRQLISLSLVALSVPTALFAQQAPRSLADKFPASSFAVFEFRGLEACKQAAQQLGIPRLTRETLDRIGDQLLGQRLDRRSKRIIEELERAGISARQVQALLRQPMAIGVGRPSFFGEVMMPSITCVVDLGNRGDEITSLVRTVVKMGVERGRLTTTKTTIAGAEFTAIARRSYVCYVGKAAGLLFIGESPDYLAECVEAAAGRRKSFAGNRAAKAGREALGTAPLASLVCNVEPLLGWTNGLEPYEVSRMRDALGVSRVTGVYFGTGAKGKNSSDVVHVGIEGPDDGLIQSLLGRPASCAAARYCAPETMVFATMSLDGKAASKAVHRFVEALPLFVRRELHRELGRELHRELSRELRGTGIDVEQIERFASLLGPEMTIAMTRPGAKTVVPQFLGFVQVKDEAKVEHALTELYARTGGPKLRSREHAGHNIYYVSLHRQEIPATPSFTVRNGYLMMSNQRNTLVEAIGRMVERKPSLADDARFQASVRSAKGAACLMNVRLSESLSETWAIARPLLEAELEDHGIHGKDAVLPDTEQLREALDDILVTLSADRHGITFKSSHPFGASVFLSLAGSVLDRLLQKRRLM